MKNTLAGVVKALEDSTRRQEEETRKRDEETRKRHEELRLEMDQNKIDLLRWFSEEIGSTFRAYTRWSKSAAGRDPNFGFSSSHPDAEEAEGNVGTIKPRQEAATADQDVSQRPREGEKRDRNFREEYDLGEDLRLMPCFLREHATPGRTNRVPFLGKNRPQEGTTLFPTTSKETATLPSKQVPENDSRNMDL